MPPSEPRSSTDEMAEGASARKLKAQGSHLEAPEKKSQIHTENIANEQMQEAPQNHFTLADIAGFFDQIGATGRKNRCSAIWGYCPN